MIKLKGYADGRIWMINHIVDRKTECPIDKFYEENGRSTYSYRDFENKLTILSPPNGAEGPLPLYLRKTIEDRFDSFIRNLLPTDRDRQILIFFLELIDEELIYSDNVMELENCCFNVKPPEFAKIPPIVTKSYLLAKSDHLKKLKKLLIQRVHPYNYKEVVIEEVYKKYKVFLIKIRAEHSFTERIIKFDAISSLKEEKKNHNLISTKIDEEKSPLIRSMFYLSEERFRSSYIPNDLMGVISLPVACKESSKEVSMNKKKTALW